jgi:monofunctional biosynthetic peptidoglycan transglycosylase
MAMVRCYRADAVSHGHRFKQSMDRIDDTSEPTAASSTAPPSRQFRPVAHSDAAAAGPAEATVQNLQTATEITELSVVAIDNAHPPLPSPPSAFLQPSDKAPSTDWCLPIPPRSQGFSTGSTSAEVGAAPRPYAPPSVDATIRDPSLRYGRPAGPRWSVVDVPITEARSDVRADKQDHVLPIPAAPEVAPPIALPMLESSGHVLSSPEQAFDALVAQPPVRPDLASGVIEPHNARDYVSLARRGLKLAGVVASGWLGLVLLLILAYRFVNPPVSALMLQRWAFGQDIMHDWVAIEDMSPHIVRAVLLSEDGRFCEHYGVDYEAIQEAMERAGDGTPRGASTISMQVVKNLFLWPSKSYLRKAIELPLTYVMEFVWPKRRIMEVYLNIAEWGPGIFGVETAAQFHFNKPARNLSEREAARLAVALPNPLIRDPGEPGPGTQRLAGAVQLRMRLAPSSQTACVLPKRRA